MKRLLAFVLILVLAFTVTSCNNSGNNGGNTDGGNTEQPSTVGATSEKILAMYTRRSPTKSVTVATYSLSNEVVLQDTTTLVSGKIDGTKTVAKLTQITQRLRSVADGSNAAILGAIEETTTVKEFFEGRGVRTQVNGGLWGGWDVSASNFAPSEGSITLNITDAQIKDIKDEGKTVSFTVPKANTESVLGKAIKSDVNVTVKNDGACIVGIELVYSEAATANTPEIEVTIKVDYTYDIENITIG